MTANDIEAGNQGLTCDVNKPCKDQCIKKGFLSVE